MKRVALIVAVLALLLGGAGQAEADPILGSSVTGTVQFGSGTTNYFDPTKGLVPSGYSNSSPGTNTVAISSTAVEFGLQDLANTDTVDFTGTQLIIQDFLHSGAVAFNWTMTFTDAAFLGATLSKTSDNFPSSVTAALVGSTITVTWPGTFTFGPNTYTAVFSLTPAADPDPPPTIVPEPTSLAMFGMTTLTAAAYFGWRRRKQQVQA